MNINLDGDVSFKKNIYKRIEHNQEIGFNHHGVATKFDAQTC